MVNTSGAQVARRSYLPFGAQWAASGSLPTDFGFTGQREADEIGLYYYVARWLDPEIAHFAQADTIVPGAGNPAAWNRYAYVGYNPIRYTDPSGHRNEGVWCMNHPDDPGCQGEKGDEDTPGNSEEFLSRDGSFTTSMQLDRNSPYVVDYYSDYLNDPDPGFTYPAVFDLILRFLPLIPFERRGDDTFFMFDYSLIDDKLFINQITVLSSYSGAGTPVLDGMTFQTGPLGSEVAIDLSVPLANGPTEILSDPLIFSTENTLSIILVVNCRNCYNTGSGAFSLILTESITLPMGKSEIDWLEDFGTIYVP
jgi:RHS repeat-associated protein